MPKNGIRKCLLLFLGNVFLLSAIGRVAAADIHVTINPKTGGYAVSSSKLGWTFGGSIGYPLQKLKGFTSRDSIGDYSVLDFNWKSNQEYSGRIRWYLNKPIVLFSLFTPNGTKDLPVIPFPDFTKFPDSLYSFSYADQKVAKPFFGLEETATPWLLFNKNSDACLMSPATDFMISKMIGDGKNHLASGLNPEVTMLPAGFVHRTILVFQKGIQKAWNEWGDALRRLYNRKTMVNDNGPLLKYVGYLANDIAFNKSNDIGKGNTQSLLALHEHYRKEGIPMGYLQLENVGHTDLKTDIINRPLASFQKEMGLPFIVNNSSIDTTRTYQQKNTFPGISSVDSGFWKGVMINLKQSGVIGFEQDGLNDIYTENPEMLSNLNMGNYFTDKMAGEAREQGINIFFAQPLAGHFMQGLKYNNLSAIRSTGKRFARDQWKSFVFNSQLTKEMGAWPKSGGFKSMELDNMIVSVLSAGSVAVIDPQGMEVKSNIYMACRPDGELVKPDAPLLPLDKNYVSLARKEKKPILAYTYTRHGSLETGYLLAFADENTSVPDFTFQLKDIGLVGKTVVYNPVSHEIQTLKAGETYHGSLSGDQYIFLMVAPVTSSGIAFLGDAGKIAATGKKRIAAISSVGKKMRIKVIFSQGEKNILLKGYAEKQPKSNTGILLYDAKSKMFSLEIKAPEKGDFIGIELES